MFFLFFFTYHHGRFRGHNFLMKLIPLTTNNLFRTYSLSFFSPKIPKLYMKFWWPLFLAFKNPTFFWPKVTFEFLNVLRGGGSTGLGNIPKKIYQCFSKQDLWFNIQVYCGVPSCSWGKSKRLRLRGCLPEKCTSSVFVNKTTNVQLCSSQRESYLGEVGGGVRGLKQLVKTKKSYSCETNDKRTNQ